MAEEHDSVHEHDESTEHVAVVVEAENSVESKEHPEVELHEQTAQEIDHEQTSEDIHEEQTSEKSTEEHVHEVNGSVEECEAEPTHEHVEEIVKTPVEAATVHSPPPRPKSAGKLSPSRLRKPTPKTQTSAEKPKTAPKLNAAPKEKPKPKAPQPRLSLQARHSIGSKTAAEEIKQKPLVLRLPRSAYTTLFSYCSLDSVKELSGVSVELHNATHSHYVNWVKEPLSPALESILQAADAKIAAKWTEKKQKLHEVDPIQVVKVEDLRALRNYRTAPPSILLLSKAIVQLMRFSPPRSGIDERAAQGDWGVIKTQFMDIKIIIRALKIASNHILAQHPLPFTSKQLEELLAIVQSPELEESKLKRTCSSLVPTLDVVLRIGHCLNVMAREIDVTNFVKQQLKEPQADEAAAASLDAILAKLDDAQPTPEKSPSASPTAAETKAKPAPKSKIATARTNALSKPKPTVDTTSKPASAKPAVAKTATPTRVPAKRLSTASSTASAPKAASNSSSSIRRTGATRSSDEASTTSSNGGTQVSKRLSDAHVKVAPKVAARTTRPAVSREKPAARTVKPAEAPQKKSTSPEKPLKRTASSGTMATLRAELVNSSEELLKASEDLKEKLALVESLHSSLNDAKTSLAEAQSEVAGLTSELEQKNKDLEARQATVLEMQCIQETLSFRVTEMTQRDTEQTTTIAQLQAEKTYLEAQLKDALARVEAAEADVEEKHALVAEKEEEHQKWEQAVRDQLTHEAQMESYELQKELEQLKSDLISLRGEHQLELESKQARIEQAEAEKRSLADELASAEHRAQLIHKERLELAANLQTAQEQTQTLTQTVEELQSELEKEKKRVLAAEKAYQESLQMNAEDVKQVSTSA